MTERPVWLAETTLVPVDIVPEPSAAYTVMLGWDAMFVSEQLAVDFSCVVHV